MFSESFIIDPETIENPGTRGQIQKIAAETLRSAGVLTAEDDRTPFEILAAMPDIEGAEDAKVSMIAAIAGIQGPL